jgi:hypothetical protein
VASVAAIKWTLVVTDVGFAAYWVATATEVVSVGTDSILRQWNWSFFALDVVAISLGLLAVTVRRRRHGLVSA